MFLWQLSCCCTNNRIWVFQQNKWTVLKHTKRIFENFRIPGCGYSTMIFVFSFSSSYDRSCESQLFYLLFSVRYQSFYLEQTMSFISVFPPFFDRSVLAALPQFNIAYVLQSWNGIFVIDLFAAFESDVPLYKWGEVLDESSKSLRL